MRNLSKQLTNRKIDYDSLLRYGFIKNNNKYIYENNILDNTFKVVIEITNDKMISKLIELSLNDEYLMVDIEDAEGEYIGKVKEEYNNIIDDVIDKCTSIDIFKSSQTKEIIKYVKDKYNDDLEYLWEKFPDNAIWRNKINNKWYGLIMTIKANKLGINSDDNIEVIDLRYDKDKIDDIIDNKKIYPGYHMNKSSWITIVLDNSMSTLDICKLIDNSYELSKSK